MWASRTVQRRADSDSGLVLSAKGRAFRQVAAICLGVALAGCVTKPPDPTPRRTVLNQEPAVVGFSWERDRPVVEVFLGTHGPYRFVLDTGAEGSSVSPECARDAGLATRLRYGAYGTGGGVKTGEMTITRIPQIRLGPARFVDVSTTVHDLSEFNCDGLLGFPVFADLLLTINGPKREIRLSREKLPAPKSDQSCLGMVPGTICPTVMGRIAGEPARFKIDSGYDGSFFLPNSWRDKPWFIRDPGGEGAIQTILGESRAIVGQVKGRVEIGRIFVTDPPAPMGMIWPVLVGGDLLKELTISFDQRSRRLRIEHRH